MSLSSAGFVYSLNKHGYPDENEDGGVVGYGRANVYVFF